jgi:integrase
MLVDAECLDAYSTFAMVVRQLALTGCRRGEIIGLKWADVDLERSCLRLSDSKEGASVRPIGLPVVEFLETRSHDAHGKYVFPGERCAEAYGALPNQWSRIFKGSALSDVTPHVLRLSFASIANDLGFTEVTIAALVGHSKGSVTSKYIHSLDTALVIAADTIAGYIQGLLDGVEFKETSYALDRASRHEALSRFLTRAKEQPTGQS